MYSGFSCVGSGAPRFMSSSLSSAQQAFPQTMASCVRRTQSDFWRPDATMAPQWGPVNFGPDPKIPQIRNKIKILSFILCLTTVTTYRTKPSSEMTAHQGPSNTYNITPNALPRDIRVRGSKPANQHYRNQSMEHRSSTTHTQPSNTEKHHTHPRNNEDTNTQQTPSTKNYYSPNSF